MKRGDIYVVTLDPTVGSEQAKTRPCVILSTDIINDFARTVTIAPLSTKKRTKPFSFHVPYKESIIQVEQLRTVDKKRLVKRVDRIDYETQSVVSSVLKKYFEY